MLDIRASIGGYSKSSRDLINEKSEPIKNEIKEEQKSMSEKSTIPDLGIASNNLNRETEKVKTISKRYTRKLK